MGGLVALLRFSPGGSSSSSSSGREGRGQRQGKRERLLSVCPGSWGRWEGILGLQTGWGAGWDQCSSRFSGRSSLGLTEQVADGGGGQDARLWPCWASAHSPISLNWTLQSHAHPLRHRRVGRSAGPCTGSGLLLVQGRCLQIGLPPVGELSRPWVRCPAGGGGVHARLSQAGRGWGCGHPRARPRPDCDGSWCRMREDGVLALGDGQEGVCSGWTRPGSSGQAGHGLGDARMSSFSM